MKIIKKYFFNIALILIVAFCPILITACTNNNSTKNENYEKAMGAAVTVIKDQSLSANPELAQVSPLSLIYEESEDQDCSQLYLLDYMKSTGASKNFDFPEKPFKANLLNAEDMGFSIYGIHKYAVDGNNISAEMAFTYNIGGEDHGFSAVDYEKINIVYDFQTDTLVSFDWISYLVQSDSLFHCVYENQTLKFLVEDASQEYETFKEQVYTSAEQLFNTEILTTKIYNFTTEYRNVFYEYNGYYPDQAE